jgi:RNA polymerase sigma factor (sigma-70 family)
MRQLVRQLVRGAGTGVAASGDSDLLRRFLDEADQDAFAEIVRRHGPMVLDVCRCVLGNRADGEDAFQATFLTLARRAGSIRKAASLAAWLHGVAYRTARRAQARSARRREREARVPARESAGPDDLSWAEVRLAVHEALSTLAECYRAPLVLCYMGGMTQDQAASALGLTGAALKKRLERGREKLRAALTRRGLGPTALVAALAMPAAVGAVPPAVADAVVRLAAPLAAGTLPGGSVPPAILNLVNAEVAPMTLSSLKAVLCAVPLLVVGAVVAGVTPQPAETRAQDPAPARTNDRKETPAEQEAKWLAGEWKVAFVEAGGQSAFPDGNLGDARITFQDGKAEVKSLQLLFVKDFSFKIDPTAKPKEIDVTFLEGDMKGKTFAGCYVTLENEVRICLRLEQTKFGRPKGFSTVSGTGLYTFFLRPVNEKDPPPKFTPKPAPPGGAAPTEKVEVVPLPPRTPFDGDAKKREGYLGGYSAGYAWAKGQHLVCPTNPSEDNLHVIRGWVEGWQAGVKAGGVGDLPSKYAPYLVWSYDAKAPPVKDGKGDAPAKAPVKLCNVLVSLEPADFKEAGGPLKTVIVSVLTDPGGKQVHHASAQRRAFPVGPDLNFGIPPGKYVLECTAVGNRGATFVPTYKKFTVTEKDQRLDLGTVYLPASKVTKLFGKPAPELDGVVAWKNTDPLTIKGLRGKVVVLDFWSYSCSICLHHKPDLARLLEKYKDGGLEVLTVHDGSAETMEEVDKKVPDVVKRKAGHLPVALDRKGDEGVFQSYGATAVPMVILIDREGKVVRRFHHAGDPELDTEVGRLLGKKQ